MEYTLYTAAFCPFCIRVQRFLEKNNIKDKVTFKDIGKDPEAREALIQGGGKKQVPCLHYGDQWLYESRDIINHLKEQLLD
ncbi:MAG: glutaredoxin family protein [Tissierellia bacterium]|nr:glutaredoxin family protein [Tissierellia bacterium]